MSWKRYQARTRVVATLAAGVLFAGVPFVGNGCSQIANFVNPCANTGNYPSVDNGGDVFTATVCQDWEFASFFRDPFQPDYESDPFCSMPGTCEPVTIVYDVNPVGTTGTTVATP